MSWLTVTSLWLSKQAYMYVWNAVHIRAVSRFLKILKSQMKKSLFIDLAVFLLQFAPLHLILLVCSIAQVVWQGVTDVDVTTGRFQSHRFFNRSVVLKKCRNGGLQLIPFIIFLAAWLAAIVFHSKSQRGLNALLRPRSDLVLTSVVRSWNGQL